MYKVELRLAVNSRSAFKSQARTLYATGGAGDPEASDEALRTALNYLPSGPPRPQTGDFNLMKGNFGQPGAPANCP